MGIFDALAEARIAASPIEEEELDAAEELALDRRWFLIHVTDFAHVLADAAKLTTVEETIYYFEKPWKWTEDYKKWRRAGSPELGDPAFEEVWHE